MATIKPTLSLVECFSGVGMQRRGIENSNLFNINSVATCEMDTDAIISYAAVHCGLTPDLLNNYTDYPSREEMASDLKAMRIGYDFVKNKEYNWDKIARSKDSKQLLKKAWLSCKLSKNYGDIMKVDRFPHCGMLTFSFPCTDVSQAGAQKGMIKGKTRSGLVYEVIRILNNMKDDLPRFLLMENVDALINNKNKPAYEAINKEFEELGYHIKYDIMNTKYTGIPQNRNRCYALYSLIPIDEFEFPHKFDNGVRLKDVLQNEDEVDEHYYIDNEKTEKLIKDLILNGTLA